MVEGRTGVGLSWNPVVAGGGINVGWDGGTKDWITIYWLGWLIVGLPARNGDEPKGVVWELDIRLPLTTVGGLPMTRLGPATRVGLNCCYTSRLFPTVLTCGARTL